jgi:hypothetical protein
MSYPGKVRGNYGCLHGAPGQVGYARDDKKERVTARRGRLLKENASPGPFPFTRPCPWQRSSPCNNPLLSVIPSEAEGPAVRPSRSRRPRGYRFPRSLLSPLSLLALDHCPLLRQTERSRPVPARRGGICSYADLSWKCLSRERISLLDPQARIIANLRPARNIAAGFAPAAIAHRKDLYPW